MNEFDYIDIIKKSNIFRDIDENSLDKLLKYLEAKIKKYEKGEIINSFWKPLRDTGLVLKGSVVIKLLSDSGEEHRVVRISEGRIFGLSFALSPDDSGETIEVVSNSELVVLYINVMRIFENAETPSIELQTFSANLIRELADKNVKLNKKVEILSKHKIRDRVKVFLMSMSKGNKAFSIPMNREKMASYLGVERSALSRELSHMKKEGLIDYRGSAFTLYFE